MAADICRRMEELSQFKRFGEHIILHADMRESINATQPFSVCTGVHYTYSQHNIAGAYRRLRVLLY